MPIVGFFQNIPLDLLLIQTVNGIVTGMILALVASGLTLIFGIMDVVNFAHGELFMLGAYFGVVVFAPDRQFLAGARSLAALIVAILGAAMQILTLRPLIGRDPLKTILATFGISLILQNYVLWQFGPVARKISEPITSHFNLFYLEYPWYRLVIAALSAAHHRRLLAVPEAQQIRRLDPRHHAGPRDGAGHGHPGAVGLHRRVRDRRRAWRRRAACCSRRWPASITPWASTGCSRPSSSSWSAAWAVSAARSRPRSSSACLRPMPRSGSARAGGHRFVRRSHPHAAVPAHRPLRADTKMTTAPLDKPTLATQNAISGSAFASSWRC